MRGKALGTMMVASLLAVGCGSSSGSACDKVVKGYQDYSSKASACGVNIPLGGFDAAACEAAFKNSGCTDADKALYGDYGTCLSNLPSCTAGNTAPFTSAVIDCTAKLSGLSSGCE